MDNPNKKNISQPITQTPGFSVRNVKITPKPSTKHPPCYRHQRIRRSSTAPLCSLHSRGKHDNERFTTQTSVFCSKLRKEDHPEAVVVVTIVGIVVVPIRHPAVPRIVVPAAAAQHAVGAFMSVAVRPKAADAGISYSRNPQKQARA